ncbi:hypothetical protein ESZ50_00515 [Weissella muntiaci]|uniref:Uncharacterized protein n=1 Tax=Weissella muntiaci TaxID=2508881 RepID=A0A6C2CA81_9LACO|nr:hypothetical protein [Weissella muntiaci]TYC51050.1 hypothetical protein ESZ50_00515 [Weissella muntiaci]
MKKHNDSILTIVIAVFSLISLTFLTVSVIDTNNQKASINDKIQMTHKKSEDLVIDEAKEKKSKRPGISNSLDALNDFFDGYYTFENQQEYNNRAKSLRNVASSDVLTDEKIFESDPYKKVKQLELQSKFTSLKFFPATLNDTEVTGSVYVSYSANYADKKAGTGQALYDVTFNRSDNKITNISKKGDLSVNTDSTLYE